MSKTAYVITLAASALLLICCVPNRYDQPDTAPDLSTPQGMIGYLRDLPAVRSVEDWPNEYGTGVTITTDHYRIHTTLLEPLMLRQVPGFMESAYRAYQKQLPRPIKTQTKFTTYIFADRSQWEAFTKTFTAPNADTYLKIKKGAYYLNGACVAYNIGRTRTFLVLGHEGWHQFNSKHFTYRLPSWLDEGIATLFEANRYEKGRFHFEPYHNINKLALLRRTLITGRMIPLRELIALNPGQVVVHHETEDVMAFYAQSYALVRFLREDNYGQRLRNFHNLLLDGLRGDWPLDPTLQKIAADRNIPLTANFNSFVSQKLFALYIDDDIDSLQKEYTTFCRKIVYHIRLKE